MACTLENATLTVPAGTYSCLAPELEASLR
jgi:hypothetical protein